MDNYNNGFIEEELEEGDDIVTLMSADGEEIDFIEIAGIVYDGKFYTILQPVQLLDGMANDEALVFLVERNENGEDKFTIVLDDDIINAVFVEYDKLYDAAMAGEEE